MPIITIVKRCGAFAPVAVSVFYGGNAYMHNTFRVIIILEFFHANI